MSLVVIKEVAVKKDVCVWGGVEIECLGRFFRARVKEKPSGRKVSPKINLDLSNIKSFFKYRI